ncbi:IclR family transcriptional regulator [Rhodococcus maanshanensis]|uniref:DNA-binding transcriptional regulator, IclR family n=1 Tax=Rhodococcus maanshanensis TaxID=183556 RepID=A0A1H7KM43_9NOCA|nr:IclR family transcriptional regulator [Rhodococcus maanshanensis]SEK87586.1 DNA-binding transcriptional regulator, IclR family [Rhodococcus maanshanensis]
MDREVSAESATSTLERASRVLDVFDGGRRLNLTQIVLRTGLPRSSVHRMLERLVSLRWVIRQGNEYGLGLRMMELGSSAVHHDPLRQAALPSLQWLHRTTGCIVHLGVLDGTDVIYLEKIGGELAAAVTSRVGGRLPAYSSAVGRAMLASYDCAILKAPGLVTVRETGTAYEREESLRGFGCIASPIGPPGGREAVAAVSICAPINRVVSEDRLRFPVRTAAAQIWREYKDSQSGSARPLVRSHSASL